MLENLIRNHKDDIVKVLSEKFNLTQEQQLKVTGVISSVLSGYVNESSGNATNKSKLMDLFDSSTSNTANPLFGNIKELLQNALSKKTDLNGEQIDQVSSGGLDSIISMLNNGALKNVDIASIFGQLTGNHKTSSSGVMGIVKSIFGSLLRRK